MIDCNELTSDERRDRKYHKYYEANIGAKRYATEKKKIQFIDRR